MQTIVKRAKHTGSKHRLHIVGDIAEYRSIALGTVGLRRQRLDLDALNNRLLDTDFRTVEDCTKRKSVWGKVGHIHNMQYLRDPTEIWEAAAFVSMIAEENPPGKV